MPQHERIIHDAVAMTLTTPDGQDITNFAGGLVLGGLLVGPWLYRALRKAGWSAAAAGTASGGHDSRARYLDRHHQTRLPIHALLAARWLLTAGIKLRHYRRWRPRPSPNQGRIVEVVVVVESVPPVTGRRSQAACETSRSGMYVDPVCQRRTSSTASLRATATTARFFLVVDPGGLTRSENRVSASARCPY
jgi:hypothetical protein